MKVNNGSGDPTKANEIIEYHVMILRELPELLAELVLAGKKEDALRLLAQWGAHARANSEVWKDAKKLLRKESA